MIKYLKYKLKRVRVSKELAELLEAASARARSYNHDYVGVEHVFLSAFALPETHVAHRVIRSLPVDVSAFIADLESYSKVITGRPVPEVIPLTPRLKHVLGIAKRYAKFGKGNEVRVVHYLLAVAVERNSAVSYILRKHIEKSTNFGLPQAAAAYFGIVTSYPMALRFEIDEEPNQALLPTPTAVTPPAGQEPRQP
jgi:ATP-dependent Clp protease ATP-binding subunit ClpA